MNYHGEEQVKTTISELKEGGLTNVEIAEKIGVDEKSIRRYQLGHEPKLSNALALFRLAKKNLNKLFEW